MSKGKEATKLIPKLYRKNFENLGLFFWVEAQKNLLPGITINQSIEKFCKFADVEIDIETARTIYERCKKEYLNG